MAESLKAIQSVKIAPACDAILVVCPEHERTFREAGWSKARLYEELYRLCEIPGEELVAGARGIAEGGPGIARRHDRQQIPPGRPDDRPRRRRRRDVFRHHRRLVLGRPRQHSRNPRGETLKEVKHERASRPHVGAKSDAAGAPAAAGQP